MELKLIYTKETDGIDYTNTAYHKIVNTYAIDDYMVDDVTRIYEDGTTDRGIIIGVKYDNKYTPEIYVLYEEDMTKIKEFKITTTSYGSLSLDEYKEFLKAQEEAMEVVKVLKNKYCVV